MTARSGRWQAPLLILQLQFCAVRFQFSLWVVVVPNSRSIYAFPFNLGAQFPGPSDICFILWRRLVFWQASPIFCLAPISRLPTFINAQISSLLSCVSLYSIAQWFSPKGVREGEPHHLIPFFAEHCLNLKQRCLWIREPQASPG